MNNACLLLFSVAVLAVAQKVMPKTPVLKRALSKNSLFHKGNIKKVANQNRSFPKRSFKKLVVPKLSFPKFCKGFFLNGCFEKRLFWKQLFFNSTVLKNDHLENAHFGTTLTK